MATLGADEWTRMRVERGRLVTEETEALHLRVDVCVKEPSETLSDRLMRSRVTGVVRGLRTGG